MKSTKEHWSALLRIEIVGLDVNICGKLLKLDVSNDLEILETEKIFNKLKVA